MGFNSVYQALKELFPQVDSRILKAVAIEHSKDSDGAVDSILTEVLPLITEQSGVHYSVKDDGKMVEVTSTSTLVPASIEGEDARVSYMLNDEHKRSSVCMTETMDDSLNSSFYDAKDSEDLLNGNAKNDDFMSFKQYDTIAKDCVGKTLDVPTPECGEDNSNILASDEFLESTEYVDNMGDCVSPSKNVDHDGAALSLNNIPTAHSASCNGFPPYGIDMNLNLDDPGEKAILDCNTTECTNSTEQASVSVTDHNLDAFGMDVIPHPDDEIQDSNNHTNAVFIQDSHVVAVGEKDETVLSTLVTGSGQICGIDLLREIIDDAKNQKETLSKEVESVITLTKEVEIREKEAQDTKVAASRGGLEILEKVEELKKMLKHAKEATDMHAGEVYGEKSILATEVRELQNRLLGLSDEKNKSLSMLEETQEVLKTRLLMAEEERRVAEQELFEKEEFAKGVLAEQELIMEKVVQESKVLQQQAEENAKLRDFLMDKGQLVDSLQGEISVICQDIKLLKENVENRVSLSKSLSIGRPSSSNSSVKSMASGIAPEQFESPKSSTQLNQPSVEGQVEERGLKISDADRKELSNEDWEVFDF